MLHGSSLLTSLLSTVPGSTPPNVAPPDFADQIEQVDVTVSDTDVVIDALDASGDPIGSLALWVDENGTTKIAADFADGYALFGIDPSSGNVRRESTIGSEVVAERIEVMLAHLDETAESNSWGECGWKAAVAGFGCATARPFLCVGGGIKAACACIPKLVEEFEDYECPWDL
jgi:hypothetical protein